MAGVGDQAVEVARLPRTQARDTAIELFQRQCV
jgi:hypothetical protein